MPLSLTHMLRPRAQRLWSFTCVEGERQILITSGPEKCPNNTIIATRILRPPKECSYFHWFLLCTQQTMGKTEIARWRNSERVSHLNIGDPIISIRKTEGHSADQVLWHIYLLTSSPNSSHKSIRVEDLVRSYPKLILKFFHQIRMGRYRVTSQRVVASETITASTP